MLLHLMMIKFNSDWLLVFVFVTLSKLAKHNREFIIFSLDSYTHPLLLPLKVLIRNDLFY